MKSLFEFNKGYFTTAIVLLVAEILIAVFVHDSIIRPYIGDFLVVILLYSFLKSMLTISITAAAIAVLAFSFFIETLQYFKIVKLLGLEDARILNVIIGNSFEWTDLLMYTLGIAGVLLIEIKRLKT